MTKTKKRFVVHQSNESFHSGFICYVVDTATNKKAKYYGKEGADKFAKQLNKCPELAQSIYSHLFN